MKRFLALLLIICLTCSLVSCAKTDNKTDEKDKQSQSNNETKDEDIQIQNMNGISQVTIKEVVLVDQKDVKITARELNDQSKYGPELKFLIENNTNQDLEFALESCSVNDYEMQFVYFSASVAAGKKMNTIMEFDPTELNLAKIKQFSEIELSFRVMDEDWEDYFISDVASITTSVIEFYKQTYDHNGKTIYDENGIKIVFLGFGNHEYMGMTANFYIYNTSQYPIIIQYDNCAINRYEMQPGFSPSIPINKHVVGQAYFDLEELEAVGIESFSSFDFSIKIFHAATWDTIAETDRITVSE